MIIIIGSGVRFYNNRQLSQRLDLYVEYDPDNTALISNSPPLNEEIEFDNGQTIFLTVNINDAEVEELIQLPGIGLVKAEAISSYRRINGRFMSINDLIEVNGIGPATLDKIRNLVHISPDSL